MKKIILSALLAGSIAAYAQVNWKIDNSHSKIGFSVKHLMISETEGKFKIYEGAVSSKSETDFTDAKIAFNIDVNSINTDDEKRDGHLKSADFFDVEKFPKMTFIASSMKPTKQKNTWILEGDLSIKGVVKKVKLTAVAADKAVKDPWGNTKYGFRVTGQINRKDFGLNWNAAIESGGVVVSDEVKLDIVIELNKAS